MSEGGAIGAPERIGKLVPDTSTGEGVLVLRVWRESAGATRFRARVISTTDVESDERDTAVFTDPTEVLSHIRDWLESSSDPG